MRIAGGIIALVLALIILVQSLAAGTADALQGSGDGGSYGFLVAILFVIGGALLFGRVMKGALATWLLAVPIAWGGGASSQFRDLWVWGFVALVYAAGIAWGLRKKRRAPELPAVTNPGS